MSELDWADVFPEKVGGKEGGVVVVHGEWGSSITEGGLTNGETEMGWKFFDSKHLLGEDVNNGDKSDLVSCTWNIWMFQN